MTDTKDIKTQTNTKSTEILATILVPIAFAIILLLINIAKEPVRYQEEVAAVAEQLQVETVDVQIVKEQNGERIALTPKGSYTVVFKNAFDVELASIIKIKEN
jgi:hypothetical protein